MEPGNPSRCRFRSPRISFSSHRRDNPPKEKLMKAETCRTRGGLVIMICLLVLWLAAPAYTAAQARPGEAEEHVKVVAHMELPRMHVNSMFVQHRDTKYYLFLHRPTKQAFAVVDVTKPERPVIVDRAAMPEPAHTSVDVNPAEPSLAISVTPEDNPGAAGERRLGRRSYGRLADGNGEAAEPERPEASQNPEIVYGSYQLPDRRQPEADLHREPRGALDCESPADAADAVLHLVRCADAGAQLPVRRER